LKSDRIELPPLEKAAEWAKQAAREKKWTESAQRWSVLRKAYPEHAMVWLQGAQAHNEADELDEAEQLLGYVHQHFPNTPNTFIISAELAMKKQKWEEAETFLQQARERFPDFPLTWLISAKCSEHEGDLDKADEYNRQARKFAPDQIQPYIQYAELAMRSQEWKKALERWELVRKQFPEAAIGYRSAAEAAQNLGDNRLARQLLLSQEYGGQLFDNEQQTEVSASNPIKHTRSGTLLGLIWTKAIFNLRSEAHRNYLSYAWLVFEPLLHILVFYIVFGTLLQRGGENFLVFLLAGQIPWMWFSKAVSGSSGSILAGKNLILQVGLPSIIFPLINLLKTSLQQIPVFFILLSFISLQGFPPSVLWWYLLPIILVQLLLTAACTCVVAAIIPFARDLNYLVHTGLMFLMFGSGIFYDYRTLSAEWQEMFLLNPMAFLLKSYREILIDGTSPDLISLGWWGTGSFIACLLMVFIYGKLRYIYPRIVME